jgi:uncharacterized protein YjbJ (UPF0337 family)
MTRKPTAQCEGNRSAVYAKATVEPTPRKDVLECKVRRPNVAPLKLKELAMDWNRIEGNWKQFKGKIKEQWGHLTDDDLDKIAGKREQLEGKIQERAGITKDAARKDVDDWLNRQ